MTVATKNEKIEQVFHEIKKVVVGQEDMINKLLIGLFTNGHVLLEGVPGLAKTLTVNTLANVLDLGFKRIQFTPDLLPADVIGTMIYNQQNSAFEVKKGPIFSNIILADEINRSPAKVQSALLEAMQEKQVTIGEQTYPLDKPFLVLATQNPVDQEGTYPLPEAQVDRFMLKVFVDYPDKKSELEIMRRMSTTNSLPAPATVLTKQDILSIREAINDIQLNDNLEQYIVDLVMATRSPEEHGLEDIKKYIDFGVSPRASIALNLASKAWAYLQGRKYVLPEDVKDMAVSVLAHRIILNFEAQADGVNGETIVKHLLDKIPVQN